MNMEPNTSKPCNNESLHDSKEVLRKELRDTLRRSSNHVHVFHHTMVKVTLKCLYCPMTKEKWQAIIERADSLSMS